MTAGDQVLGVHPVAVPENLTYACGQFTRVATEDEEVRDASR